MTKLVILVLISSLAAVALGQTERWVPPEKTTPHPEPPVTTSSTSSTTSATTKSTSKTTSITPPTTTTTSSTTSTTAAPKTTTTPSTTTTSTTAKPTKPTPAPEPPKPVEPKVGVWQLNYKNSNVSCVLLAFALQMEVPYDATNNKTYSTYVNVPSNATATGGCSTTDTQMIELTWLNADNKTDTINLSFVKNATSKIYRLTDIQVSLTPDNNEFPAIANASVLSLTHKHDEFKTTLSKSYKCAKKQELNLTDDSDNKPRGSIAVSNLEFQVFQNSTNKQFTDVEDCAPSDTPDVVPIAVGCALAALVIIVLIAYLIGRRRGQARGYLSMFTETKQESDYIPMKNLSCFQ